jgi:Ca-activated chloride channel family protein
MSDLFLTDLMLSFEAFHLLRPLWILLLVPVAGLWWLNRRAATRIDAPVDGLAPHLRVALTLGGQSRNRILPIDTVALVLMLVTVGASGPTWTRQVDPFLAQTGPLVVVLKVTPSMTGTDIAPTRLERAQYKIRDLLDLRAGARTALVAYAGSAHRVLPFTEDPKVMVPYLDGLAPEVMPQVGANATKALEIATDLLAAEETPGGILFVLDSLDPQDAGALNVAVDNAISVLAMLPEGQANRGLDQLGNVPVVRVSADNADIARIDRILNVDYRRALLANDNQPWEDRGWWLALPAALLCLIWYRQGWTMRWALILLGLGLTLAPPGMARADGIADWFLTPDQQGWRAYQNNDFIRAAELFQDPMWRGHALYRSGQYVDAIELLDRQETPEASFTQGLAHIKNRQYRDGVRAFETTLQREPDFPGAAQNLKVAQEIVDYIEATREASDTGEETGLGADDVVYDNESNRGADTQTDRQPRGEEGILTTEQWMNTVDTRTSDFLRLRFQIEAARSSP